jgi:DNA ligase-1
MSDKPWAPMLAASEIPTPEQISFPCMASFKLDGIRSPIIGGKAMSRKLLPLPNTHYQEWVSANHQWLEGIDCEVISGSPVGEGVFHRTQSAIMSADGAPDFKIYVFDSFQSDSQLPAWRRYTDLEKWFHGLHSEVKSRVVLLEQRLLQSVAELESHMDEALDSGFEGLILKNPQGLYKNGRSTLKEGTLLKWKVFTYEDCRILGVIQGKTNQNVKTKDALGHAKRSTAKEGMKLINSVGGFRVVDAKSGEVFDCGTGCLKADELKELWAIKDSLVGRYFTYKSQPYGVLKKPRFPGFNGWKSLMDMEPPKY